MTVMDHIRGTRGLTRRIARECGISDEAVRKWSIVPDRWLDHVERATGMPRHELRPDLYVGYVPAPKPTAEAVAA